MMNNYKYLWFFTLAYTCVLLMVNWFDSRIVMILGFITDAGTLIFPLTFLLAGIITEVYGYKYTRRAIWVGFAFNLFYLLYGQLITLLPRPPDIVQNIYFDQIMNINVRIIMASMISYLISEPLNALVLAKLKIKFEGRLMNLRFLISSFSAAGVDSVIFTILAFLGLMSVAQCIELCIVMWTIKVMIELLLLPLTTKLALVLKRIEATDTYDLQTSFTIFSLDNKY